MSLIYRKLKIIVLDMIYAGAVLDLDDVLFPTSDYVERALHSAVDSMIKAGLPTSTNQGLEKLLEIRRKEGSNAENHFDLLCEAYGLAPPPQRIVQSGISAYHSERERSLVPQAETNEFLDFLAANNFRSCILSSGIEAKQWFKLVRLGIVNYFLLNGAVQQKELVYIVEDKGNRLESKCALVSRFIEEAEIDPSKSIVVDDRPYGIVAAKKAGIRYGFRVICGKYSGEDYEEGTPDALKHDESVINLRELKDLLQTRFVSVQQHPLVVSR